ncbi:hypothetical protein CWI39_0272p0030 [Hamiltosporidium magnivora]|uniref:Uncharacterized protein n=1 Tax=Hamiltosporidium magnivora TaxID=148818 RepID=A0A4Q9LIG8_9MICR|nr:hypothetical protein CWI39_0272p0030 [Hamiltosporidium magnivora]
MSNICVNPNKLGKRHFPNDEESINQENLEHIVESIKDDSVKKISILDNKNPTKSFYEKCSKRIRCKEESLRRIVYRLTDLHKSDTLWIPETSFLTENLKKRPEDPVFFESRLASYPTTGLQVRVCKQKDKTITCRTQSFLFHLKTKALKKSKESYENKADNITQACYNLESI